MSTKQFKFSESAPSAPYYCGIDVHKHELAVCIYCSGKTQQEFTKHSVFGTDCKSLDAFWNFTRKYQPAGYVMEATNIYHQIIYNYLKDKRERCRWPFRITIINPADASGIPGRQKYDKIDAENLARYLAKDLIKPSKALIESLEDLKAVFRAAHRVQRDRTALKNRITKILDQAGIRPRKMNLNSDWVIDLLRSFICFQGTLGNFLIDIMKKGHPLEKHWTYIKKSINNWQPYGDFSLTHPKKSLIRQLLGQLDFMTARKNLLALEVDIMLSHEPGLRQIAHNLSTIPGISKFTAVWILCEIGNINQYSNVKKYLSFCGCCPRVVSSANKVYFAHINRHSNKYLRTIFYNAAVVVVNLGKEPSALKDYANRVRARKSSRAMKLVYSIVSAKIAKISYLIMRENTIYQPYPDSNVRKTPFQNQGNVFNVCQMKSIRRARNCLLNVRKMEGIGPLPSRLENLAEELDKALTWKKKN